MAINSSTSKLAQRPKFASIRIDEVSGSGDDIKAGWQKSKERARGSVINIINAARGSPRRSEKGLVGEERLGPRPVSRRVRAPAKSSLPTSLPTFDISDDVLSRLTGDPSDRARRPTSKFLVNQRQRAGVSDSISSRRQHSHSQAAQDRRPLNADDLVYMFAGAPYFDSENDGEHAQIKVEHGWAPSTTESRNATDYAFVKHTSFQVCTIERSESGQAMRKRRRAIREMPNMRSANGADPGSTGMQHFLELPLQDQEATDIAAMRQKQMLLISDPDLLGLRDFDIANVVDRLAELSRVYEMLRAGRGEAAGWDQGMIEEIGEDLFSTLLSTDLGTTSAGTGSVSLRTQISALQKVLNTENLWYDFNKESWRAQLGRLLWQPAPVSGVFNHAQPSNERDILMLQIALGAELAVRLEIADRLAASHFRHAGIFAHGDLDSILDAQNDKLDWDVLLFQRFVQCFKATSRPHGPPSPLRRLSFIHSVGADTSLTYEEPNLILYLRKEEEQWDGLRAFASELGWPESDSTHDTGLPKFDSFLTPPSNERYSSDDSQYDTPMSSPVKTGQHSPKIKTPALILLRSQNLLLPHTAFDEVLPIHGTGEGDPAMSWTTKSWLSGFMLPGSSASQSLMYALLETSSQTKPLLEEIVDMNEGFVHQRQTYLSRESVVGRVLAPTMDARECMGWISLPFVPQGQGNSWIQTYTKEAPYALMESRMCKTGLVASSSDPLRAKDAATLQAGDFFTLVDGHMIVGNEAQFHGVSLTSSKVIRRTADGFLVPKIANLTFKSPTNSRLAPLTLPLTYAVQFVSSYPCFPTTASRRIPSSRPSPAHDSLVPADSGRSTPVSSAREKELPLPPAHPLHVGYTYTIIPAAALLSSELPEVKDSDSLILMDSGDDDKPSIYQIDDQEVIVLDCRGSPDLEVLARAWCAKLGENALVGKSGRTCLACCIREAVGLGIGVVLRTS